ncbi:MAG: glycoside hydrolase family 57 protein [Candidatus Omnitrophica bacterium]|nr:glycoside hydrolase family 57 protein [Candidatus Omnitrophota bacterium]
MNKQQTNVIFLWHMHQPYYKHPEKKHYILPWVRLHAVKDYYGMARVIDKFNKTKVAVNFSGCLLEQIIDYAVNDPKDLYVSLTLKNPRYLNKEEKDFIVERFFSVTFDRYIKINKRYLQLYNKKSSGSKKFTISDISDLQALFNLAWFHPYSFSEDKRLAELRVKEKGYTEADKKYIIDKQKRIIAEIIPLYKKLVKAKKIELTVSPYHHPILPLVYDTDIVRDFPYMKGPRGRFNAVSDCHWHLRESKNIFKETFGSLPIGSWPSEGSLSESVVSLYEAEGFKWTATDEAVLFKSLMSDYVTYEMISNQRHLIYRPYKFKGLDIFFRDRVLSDRIGFIYQGWDDAVFAANDLIDNLNKTHFAIKGLMKQRVISIIMDGENAWEYYFNNGVDFLESLYSGIEKSDNLETITPKDFLKTHVSRPLERLASGSWINGDFGVWVGSKKNNEYWQLLKKIKSAIDLSAGIDSKKIKEAKKYLRLIEGSDWFWWNTFEDSSGEFNRIFYLYISKIYRLLGKKNPTHIR